MTRVLRSAISALLAGGLIAAAPSPQPLPQPSSAADSWCPVAPTVVQVDDTHVALGFWTPLPAGRSSGTVALFTRDAEYDVRFDDALILHRGKADGAIPLPKPIVLRFSAPEHIESAVVTSLDTPTPGRCDPPYVPWRDHGPNIDPSFDPKAMTSAEGRRAAEAIARDAPAAVPYTPPQCPVRFKAASTRRAYEPEFTPPRNSTTVVLVTVGVDGRALAVETFRSSGDATTDIVAKDAAARSQYVAEIYECRPIIGTYLFSVEFTTR